MMMRRRGASCRCEHVLLEWAAMHELMLLLLLLLSPCHCVMMWVMMVLLLLLGSALRCVCGRGLWAMLMSVVDGIAAVSSVLETVLRRLCCCCRYYYSYHCCYCCLQHPRPHVCDAAVLQEQIRLGRMG